MDLSSVPRLGNLNMLLRLQLVVPTVSTALGGGAGGALAPDTQISLPSPVSPRTPHHASITVVEDSLTSKIIAPIKDDCCL